MQRAPDDPPEQRQVALLVPQAALLRDTAAATGSAVGGQDVFLIRGAATAAVPILSVTLTALRLRWTL